MFGSVLLAEFANHINESKPKKVGRPSKADLARGNADVTVGDLRSIVPKSPLCSLVLNMVTNDDRYKNTLCSWDVRKLLGGVATDAEFRELRKTTSLQDSLRHGCRFLVGGWYTGRERLIDYVYDIISRVTTILDVLDAIRELEKSEFVKRMVNINCNDHTKEQVNDALAFGHKKAYICTDNLPEIFLYSLLYKDFATQDPYPPGENPQNPEKPEESDPPGIKKQKLNPKNDSKKTTGKSKSIPGASPSDSKPKSAPINKTPKYKKYEKHHFCPTTNHSPPLTTRLCFLDNCSVHRTAFLQQVCSDEMLLLLFFPPNMTWFLQPLDLTVNQVVKAYIRRITSTINNYRVHYPDRDFSHLNTFHQRVM